ncbi:uncharacterized protein LOC133742563 isoform X1 [Rosa rugosa]|uniref:uncharacterized protein LOC133742563 isoform X1 n=1 Tax=Rosa rugosa TaxID=74645 RepID=UPI002B40A03C|nr:uncharacterized protein LOC133742563 isoform X1 [Rosa rugosa]
MATEKMHRCLGRTNNDSQKLSIRRKFKEKNSLRTSLEDWEAASVARRNFNHRSAFLTLLSLEPDDSLRIVALPLHCPVSTNFSGSGARVNMDSLRLFYTKGVKVISPKVQQGSPLAGSYCGKSFTNSRFAVSTVRHQSRNKELAYEATKSNELSRESCQKSLTCSASSSMIATGSNSNNLSDTVGGSEKVDNVKRKSRKKGKKGKKLSGTSSSTGPHMLSVECADESSASETCGNSGGSGHCGPVSLSTTPEVSLPESGVKNESPKSCISHQDELEVYIPSVGYLGHQSVLQDSEFPIEDWVGSIPRIQMSHCNDLHTGGYSDMHDSFVSDSISVGSNCDDNDSDGHDEKHAEKEIHRLYEPSGFSSRKGYFSCQSLLNDVVKIHDSSERTRHGIPKRADKMELKDRVSKELEREGESNLLQVQYLPHLLCKAGIQVQKETSLAESSRVNPSSGSLNHKLVPIELKDPVTSSTSSLADVHSDKPADKRWTPTDAAKGITENNSSEEAVVCVGQSSGDVTCNSDKTEDMLLKLGYQDASTIEELKDKLNAAKCMNFESKDLNAVEPESNRIIEAVNNACRAQLASEAVQMFTGGPIAEFERLLYHSSPVVHESPNFIRCQTCSRNQVPRLPVCRHETTNISLGCLWKWYQRSGSYGLEIRAEEFGNSKGLGADRCAFHAYFAPYLSAIQLFRSCRSDSVCNAVSINELCISKQSSAPANNPVQLTDTTRSSDLELLFEYFESEQPQQRQPLYDKIKELIRGDQPSYSNVYGDPTTLETINLNDLHPRSWYSVAWYPIYRIPHGNLRAAFLTYHSLGHLVCRSANFESPSVDACIVSPVVGLQSYNAQDECWFQPRHSGRRQTTVTPGPGLNCYNGVLEERLRTLEETASLMARAVVKKGSMTSVNRHPDYEFFLSRRR